MKLFQTGNAEYTNLDLVQKVIDHGAEIELTFANGGYTKVTDEEHKKQLRSIINNSKVTM